MLESAWLFIGLVAILATALTVITSDDGTAIMAGVVGFITWGFFAFGSLDVRVVGDAVTYSFSMPAVTIFAVMMAMGPGYIALTGPIEIIARADNPTTDEI